MKVSYMEHALAYPNHSSKTHGGQRPLIALNSCPNGMFRRVKQLKIDSKIVVGGRCMRESD